MVMRQVCAKMPHDLGPAWPCLARSLRGYGHNRDSAWPAPHARARASSAVAHSSNDYSSALAAPTCTQRAGIVVSATATAMLGPIATTAMRTHPHRCRLVTRPGCPCRPRHVRHRRPCLRHRASCSHHRLQRRPSSSLEAALRKQMLFAASRMPTRATPRQEPRTTSLGRRRPTSTTTQPVAVG